MNLQRIQSKERIATLEAEVADLSVKLTSSRAEIAELEEKVATFQPLFNKVKADAIREAIKVVADGFGCLDAGSCEILAGFEEYADNLEEKSETVSLITGDILTSSGNKINRS